MYCLSEEKGNNKVQGDEGGGGGALGLKVLGVYTSTFSHSQKQQYGFSLRTHFSHQFKQDLEEKVYCLGRELFFLDVIYV